VKALSLAVMRVTPLTPAYAGAAPIRPQRQRVPGAVRVAGDLITAQLRPVADAPQNHFACAQHLRVVALRRHAAGVSAPARAYAQTEDFKVDMKRRAGVERIIACLTRYHDARRARRRGLLNADFQAKLSAMAFNLKQWMKLLRHGQVVRR
jgi:hypothetical protein